MSLILFLLVFSVVAGVSESEDETSTSVLQEDSLTGATILSPSPVQEIQTCQPIQYEAYENIYDTCTTTEQICDETNTTCSMQERQYQCITGARKIMKPGQQCTTIGFTISQ